jgi:hypothetical protein
MLVWIDPCSGSSSRINMTVSGSVFVADAATCLTTQSAVCMHHRCAAQELSQINERLRFLSD